MNNGKTAANPSEPWEVLAEERFYTAKDLAAALGTSDRNLLQKWLPKLLEAHKINLHDLKEGDLFTEEAFELFSNLQQAISPKVPRRDSRGEIVYRDGKPIMIANPDRIGFPAYCKLLATVRDQDNGALVPVEEEIIVIDAELDAELEDSLSRLDCVGSQIDGFTANARQFGAEFGQQMASAAIEEAAKSFQETFQTGLAAMGQSMAPKRRKK